MFCWHSVILLPFQKKIIRLPDYVIYLIHSATLEPNIVYSMLYNTTIKKCNQYVLLKEKMKRNYK